MPEFHRSRTALLVVAAATAALALSGCTESTKVSSSGDDSRTITVDSSADACKVSTTTVPAGTLTFDVSNTGSQVTEFYLLASDGLRIVGEIENIGPSLTRQLVVSVPAGDYLTACKPGMTGKGIRADFTVQTASNAPSASADDSALVDQALSNYAAYVEDQSDQLVQLTQQFVKAYEAGDDDEARRLYPLARTPWERIETVAESFGDLDPKTDAREADLEAGQKWTGWHRIEKDLWPPAGYTALTMKERRVYGQNLLANITTLDRRVPKLTYTVDQITNGSRGLLDEVATGKVTGEEEAWSHTDLYDFQANVDGARVGFEGVKPILEQKDPALATTLTARFAALQKLLDEHKSGDGFVSYDQVDQAQRQQLSAAVNALAEPLSKLTAAVLS